MGKKQGKLPTLHEEEPRGIAIPANTTTYSSVLREEVLIARSMAWRPPTKARAVRACLEDWHGTERAELGDLRETSADPQLPHLFLKTVFMNLGQASTGERVSC